MPSLAEHRQAALQATEIFWFIQSLEEIDHTDVTLSLRLHIRPGLFVQVFAGEITGTISFALIDGNSRIFGLDYHRGRWHLHPYGQVTEHKAFDSPLAPTPLYAFLEMVRDLLLEYDIL